MNSDYAIFCVVCLLMAAIVCIQVGKRLGLLWFRQLLWVGMLATILSTYFAARKAVQSEHTRRQEMVEAFAPTYAEEISRLGHSKIRRGTPESNDALREIKATLRRWTGSNSRVDHIFTLRRTADGRIYNVVSGSDNLGDTWVLAESPQLRDAFDGIFGLEQVPEEKPSGSWLTSYLPMRDETGKVEAVMGLQMNAAPWIESTRAACRYVLINGALAALLVSALIATLGIWMLSNIEKTRRQNQSEREKAQIHEAARLKLESIVDSIEEVVWEWAPVTRQFIYLSRQLEEVFGDKPEVWYSDANIWTTRLHPDDRENIRQLWQMAKARGGAYKLDYRIIKASGETAWIRESGNVIPGDEGAVVRGVFSDITPQKMAAEELECMNRQLVESFRQAGMAEVATGILHNVGNLLNSVNVSSGCISRVATESRSPAVKRLATLLEEKDRDGGLPEFFSSDARAAVIPKYLSDLADTLEQERQTLQSETATLESRISHIREVIMMQQGYAKVVPRMESLCPESLLEDALRINEASFVRHNVRVIRDYHPVPQISGDRSRILQILVNLMRNASQALEARDYADRQLFLSLRPDASGSIVMTVRDNGCGIAPEHLHQLFTFGFTTREEGHGFGLHSSIVAAREMDAELRVASEGLGHGAAFSLELRRAPHSTALLQSESLTANPS